MTNTDDDRGVEQAAVPTDQLLGFFRGMIEIRLFEEETQRLFMANLVRGSTHLCSGQEAVAVGACAVLRDGDSMLCTYRGHGAVLAKGAPIDRTFAEILGKAQGLCGGKGGSMHITDISCGAYGSIATVGAHLPIAVGLGFAARYTRTEDVCLCFFGDGATNIGAFHEALNLAAIWKLPVLFVCENNLYGEYTALHLTTPIDRLADRATELRHPGRRDRRQRCQCRLSDCRLGGPPGPCRRGPDPDRSAHLPAQGPLSRRPGRYRPQEEVEAWLARDPIAISQVGATGTGCRRGHTERGAPRRGGARAGGRRARPSMGGASP